MFAQIGAVLPRSPATRTSIPVRRQSRRFGQCETPFWRRSERRIIRTILLAARRYDLVHKKPGARSGPLGHVGIEIIELFANLIDYKSGRLDPSIDYLMRKLRRSRDAIVRALKALRDHGFLDWLRRYAPTGNYGRGPQVKQISNAYRLSLPARAKVLLGRYGTTPPVPDDHAHAVSEKTALIEAHRNSLETGERTLFDFGNTPLGWSLARLGRLIQQRESAKQTESLSSSILNRED